MSVKIQVPTDQQWNVKELTLVEETSALGDSVLVCIHLPDIGCMAGSTVKVPKSAFLRAAKMLDVPHASDPEAD